MPQLDGRVFSRLQQYEALPTDLKDEVSALIDYLTVKQAEVFGLHHANLIKSVRSVRAKPLTEKITAWLLQKEAPTTTVSAETDASKPAATEPEATKPAETTAEATPAPALTEDEAAAAKEAAAKAKDEAAATLKAEQDAAAAKLKAEQEAAAARLAHAKTLLNALVLKGFVTPYKESDKAAATPETLAFGDRELFVPLAAAVAAEPTSALTAATQEASTSTSTPAEASATAPAEPAVPAPLPTTVWDLVDGAVFAGALKRKAGLFAPLTAGKDVYAVVNARRKTLTLFETDLGRVPVVELGFDGASVAFDKSHFVHGVKVWNETITELLNASTKLEREALVHALLAVGLTYHEELAPGLEKVETVYELKDTTIDGQEMSLDAYKGKVLLIVNVSSKCGLTPTNYPELVALDEKYRAQGLAVLAFPCNQFMGQEPGSHDEITEFVKQYNATFPFFTKGDVNGVDTRPVFAFLKHKLPASYIQWNFTKFLVDRNGVPVKRFGPMELPFSFEGEIVKLLGEEAKVVAPVETAATAAAVEAPVVAATAAVVADATDAPAVTTEKPAPVPEVTEAVAAPEVPVPVEAAAPPAVEPTPEAAPVEETKAPVPVAVEKPAAPAPTPVAPVEETKPVAAPVVVETPAPVVVEQTKTVEPVMEQQTKVEEVLKTEEPAVSPSPADEPTLAAKLAPAAVEESNQNNVPVQGFTPGNEPTAP